MLMSHAPSTYKIPTSYDWPDEFTVNLVHWGRNKEQTIYRSKAVGEPPLMLSMSVFHAIRDAIAATAGDQPVQLDAFYFIWLDMRLNVPPRDPENDDVAGDLWAVHGGGFYHAQKYKVAPGELPDPLHWFKWEAYFTWITGFLLIIVVYYLNARSMLIDPRIADIGPGTAVGISLGLLLAGFVVYAALCALKISERSFALLGSIALLLGECSCR
jgi:hypothetical protein